MKTRHSGLNEWIGIVSEHLPHLSRPQAVVLAMWSLGMVMTRSCGLTTVSVFLATLLGQKENTVRQRLREWCRAAKDKKGADRTEIKVTTCFAPLLRWILQQWAAGERRLALAMDATTLGALFTVLCISVVYRGCAIPVAWVIVSATKKGSWQPHWESLFQQLQGSVPAEWTVIVLADRGLYARWLYQAIVKLGWHPFLRLNHQGKYSERGRGQFFPLADLVKKEGAAWCGLVTCFKRNSVDCTLVARWDAGHTDPWLIMTDLPPDQAQALWYGLRAWIEAGFKQCKRAGWQWQQTRMTDPERASRLWLAMAVATLWVVSVGGQAEVNLPASSFDELPETHIARRRTTRRSQPRLISCFRRGIIVILSTFIAALPFPPPALFCPEPWPSS